MSNRETYMVLGTTSFPETGTKKYILPNTWLPPSLPGSRHHHPQFLAHQIDGAPVLGAQAAQWLWSKHIERLKVHLKRLVEAASGSSTKMRCVMPFIFAARSRNKSSLAILRSQESNRKHLSWHVLATTIIKDPCGSLIPIISHQRSRGLPLNPRRHVSSRAASGQGITPVPTVESENAIFKCSGNGGD